MQAVRYLAGLGLGVGVVVVLWTAGDIWRWGRLGGYALHSSLLPLVPAVFFVLLMLWNKLRPLPHAG